MEKFLLFSATAEKDPQIWIVCLIGVAVVFAGLAILIGVIEIMNRICDKIASKKATTVEAAPTAPVAPTAPAAVENRSEIVAAVCAAVAEENGTDISAIRVVSFKKL
ncbi:MAG: OadG family protein [Clostridia bacterium]|nr:OadG family protein [Clostridia bacterium]